MTLVHFLYLLLVYFVIQLILSVLQTIYSIRANNEKYKAHKALQKGFHVEFSFERTRNSGRDERNT